MDADDGAIHVNGVTRERRGGPEVGYREEEKDQFRIFHEMLFVQRWVAGFTCFVEGYLFQRQATTLGCNISLLQSLFNFPQRVHRNIRYRSIGMNLTGRSSSVLIAMVCLSAAFPACEAPNHDAYFAETSQSATAVDLRPGASGRTGVAVEGTGRPEGIGRRGRYYYYIRNGAATPLYQRQRFAQGYWVDPKGRVIARDGSVVVLTNGEMVTFAGEHLPIPPGTDFPQRL